MSDSFTPIGMPPSSPPPRQERKPWEVGGISPDSAAADDSFASRSHVWDPDTGAMISTTIGGAAPPPLQMSAFQTRLAVETSPPPEPDQQRFIQTEHPVLFLSNGHGEDAIAEGIIRHVRALAPDLPIAALPLVGRGMAYRSAGIPVVGPRRLMPSGGLIPANYMGNIVKDLQSGLGRLVLDQIRFLRSVRGDLRGVVAVGDTVPVLLGGLFGPKPMVFVGTAKSNYYVPYSWLERMAFQRWCRRVFVRDAVTAGALAAAGVRAEWVGNPMMDCLAVTGADFGSAQPSGLPGKVVGILPGSRDDVFEALPILLRAVEALASSHPGEFSFLMAVADAIPMFRLEHVAGEGAGWIWKEPAARERAQGVEGILAKGDCRVLLVKGRFGDVIAAADLVLGQAGTGNEQAAGLGKPVVAYEAMAGRKLGWYRARQQGLLGEALSVVQRDPAAIAQEIVAILQDRERYQRMSAAGRERMGPPGGALRLAEAIVEELSGPRT